MIAASRVDEDMATVVCFVVSGMGSGYEIWLKEGLN